MGEVETGYRKARGGKTPQKKRISERRRKKKMENSRYERGRDIRKNRPEEKGGRGVLRGGKKRGLKKEETTYEGPS